MYSMQIVKVYYKDSLDFEFIPEDMDILSDLIDEAKKRFEQKHGKKPGALVSLPINERVEISSIDAKYKTGWAPGAKTVPVVSFEISD